MCASSRFFVADERNKEGKPVAKTSGKAHADLFLQLAKRKLDPSSHHVCFTAEGGVTEF